MIYAAAMLRVLAAQARLQLPRGLGDVLVREGWARALPRSSRPGWHWYEASPEGRTAGTGTDERDLVLWSAGARLLRDLQAGVVEWRDGGPVVVASGRPWVTP